MHCWLNCAQPRAALIQLQARWRQGEETPVSVLFTTSKWSSAICGVRRHGATGCCDVVSPTQAGRRLCNAAPLDAGQDRASRPRRLVTRNRPSDRRPDRFSCRSVRANARVRALAHGPGCLCAPATGGELEMRRTNPINVKDYNVVLFVANAEMLELRPVWRSHGGDASSPGLGASILNRQVRRSGRKGVRAWQNAKAASTADSGSHCPFVAVVQVWRERRSVGH
ncbi:hypothetical protein ABIB80_005584 [Bradyrhizobium sp. i1.15.2]